MPRSEISFFVDENGCWICTSHMPHKGMGRRYFKCTVHGRAELMHRHMYRLVHGDIPEGRVVRHTCDNPLCINPAHLLLGTHADNVRDRVNRGRSAIGEKNGRAKLTEAQVRAIRQASGRTGASLARQHQVDRKVIHNIRHRKSWKHVS